MLNKKDLTKKNSRLQSFQLVILKWRESEDESDSDLLEEEGVYERALEVEIETEIEWYE